MAGEGLVFFFLFPPIYRIDTLSSLVRPLGEIAFALKRAASYILTDLPSPFKGLSFFLMFSFTSDNSPSSPYLKCSFVL